MADPRVELDDPNTSAQRLFEIAQSNPELGSLIASHPNAYPELVQWVSQTQPAEPAVAAETVQQPEAPHAEQYAQPTQQYPQVQQQYRQPQQYTPQTTPLQQGGYPAAGPAAAATAAAPGGPGYPAGPGPYPQTGGRQPPRKSRKGMWIAIIAIVVVVALVATGLIIWNSVANKISGSKTPEAAAQKMVEGFASVDPLTIYGSLSPSEVSAFQEPFDEWLDMDVSEEDDATARELMNELAAAFDISVDDLEIETEEIIEGVERSVYRSGTITVDGDEDKIVGIIMEMYDLNSDLADSTGMGPGLGMMDEDMVEDELRAELDLPQTLDFAEIGRDSGTYVSVVTVEENGQWYVSPLLTGADIAYQVMQGLGAPSGRLGTSLIEGVPSDSPEAAAAALTDAIVNGDSLEDVATHLPLAERRLISIYGPAFEIPSDWNDEIDLRENEFSSERDGSKARISIENLEIVQLFTSYGSPQELENSILLWDHCAEVTSEYYSSWEDEVISNSFSGCLNEIGIIYEEFGIDHFALIGVEEDGGWYVSPINTIADMTAVVIGHVAELSREGRLEEVLESVGGY